MKTWFKIAFIIVLFTVVTAIIYHPHYHFENDTRDIAFEHQDFHPENGVQSNGTDVITDEGNMFSPYFQLSYSEGDWMLEFEMDSETGDGYILGSITVEVDVPDGMRIEDVIVSIPESPTYMFYTIADHDIDSATTVTRVNVDYFSDPPTIDEPTIVITPVDSTDGPISCEFTAMFVKSGMFSQDIEVVRGSFDVYTDGHDMSM